MHEWYERTALTPMRVARASGYIDWGMQPASFKRYPDGLFSYDISEHEALKPIALARCVTSRQQVGGRPYLRLNVPSAGNLHPIELYVQIRGIRGIVSGIYHVDANREKLVLIREVGGDGLEHTLGLKGRLKGMLFLLSGVPFRSLWKYGERSSRYCLLDAGHQLGALQAAAAACGQELTILSDFDASCLDALMGFDGQEQSLLAACIGSVGERPCDPMPRPLMQVQPTDYCDGAPDRLPVPGAGMPEARTPYKGIDLLETVIKTRRSSRAFAPEAILPDAMEQLMQMVSQPPQPLVCHSVVLRGEAPEPGLYEGGRLVRRGHFVNAATALLVDQAFVSTSSLVLVITAPIFSAKTLAAAGMFAHTLQLHSCARRLGFSPIGAFYDRKLQHFLQTDNYILYALVIGHDPE
jgi:SagB-type dehydrogenase family enzyme